MAAKASPYCKELAIADKLTECVFFLDEVYKTLDAVSKGASPVDMNTMLIMKARYFCAVPNEFKFVRWLLFFYSKFLYKYLASYVAVMLVMLP